MKPDLTSVNVKVKEPFDYSKEELDMFEELVTEGHQVDLIGLAGRIIQCKVLGFGYIKGELAGVSAIKIKPPAIVNLIRKKADAMLGEIPSYELGYSFTRPNFRRQGINKLVNDALLKLVDNEKIFATTDNDSMRRYLASKGFHRHGKSFPGNYNNSLEYYEK